MTPADKFLAEVKGRSRCATAGPWFQTIDCIVGDRDLMVARLNVNAQVAAINGNGRFIAHARTDVDRLVTMVGRLRDDLVTVRNCGVASVKWANFLAETEVAIDRIAAGEET
jgi:hypothetical protein